MCSDVLCSVLVFQPSTYLDSSDDTDRCEVGECRLDLLEVLCTAVLGGVEPDLTCSVPQRSLVVLKRRRKRKRRKLHEQHLQQLVYRRLAMVNHAGWILIRELEALLTSPLTCRVTCDFEENAFLSTLGRLDMMVGCKKFILSFQVVFFLNASTSLCRIL